MYLYGINGYLLFADKDKSHKYLGEKPLRTSLALASVCLKTVVHCDALEDKVMHRMSTFPPLRSLKLLRTGST